MPHPILDYRALFLIARQRQVAVPTPVASTIDSLMLSIRTRYFKIFTTQSATEAAAAEEPVSEPAIEFDFGVAAGEGQEKLKVPLLVVLFCRPLSVALLGACSMKAVATGDEGDAAAITRRVVSEYKAITNAAQSVRQGIQELSREYVLPSRRYAMGKFLADVMNSSVKVFGDSMLDFASHTTTSIEDLEKAS